jgi:hypothetical protein
MLHVFQSMEMLLAQPRMAYFGSFREDFFVHDRRELVDWGGPSAHYIWVVRSSGTHLIRIGVHPRHTEHGIAALRNLEGERSELSRTFIVSTDAVKEIPKALALSMLAETRPQYEVNEGWVSFSCRGTRRGIAQLRIEREVLLADIPRYHVWFSSRTWLGTDQIGALRLIARGEVLREARSLFASAASIHIDELDVVDAMRLAREGELAAR